MKKKIVAALMCALMLISVASCDKSSKKDEVKPASYGTYGSDFARKLAASFPGRKAYSDQETKAGTMIKKEFEDMGFKVETQTFNSLYQQQSNNYIVRLKGQGFLDKKTGKEVRRKVVIGAHYDSSYAVDEIPEDRSYDGISDNASGIGCLLTVAKHIKDYKDIGFDVDIVAFGASNDDLRGARAYYDSLEDKSSVEVMYCIDSIYAGDKIYASAGMNSLKLDQKYSMRRKLYQAYDVAYNDMLSSLNGFNLYYNESLIVTDLNGDGVEDAYREVSLNKSDYSVFDEKNIPVVYFDSCDYNFKDLEKMKETKNLHLQEFDGKIRGTMLDSTKVLDEVLKADEKDILQLRINNVAYVILGSLLKGSDFGLTKEQYDDYQAKIKAGVSVTPVP